MTTLESTISRLSDRRAIELVKRFVRANHTAKSQSMDTDIAAALCQELSLPDEQLDPASPGDVARSTLLLLASDRHHRSGIAALLADPTPSSFGPGSDVLEPAEILSVLQTQTQDSGADSVFAFDSGNQSGLLRSAAQQLLAYAGLRRTGATADAEYRIWYATSRRPLDPVDASKGYGVERDKCVHFGTCTVFVPKSHKIGSVGSPWWKRAATLTDDRMRILALQQTGEDAFWQDVAAHLSSCPEQDREAVVFVHGFNVDFREAALRAAQLGFDLQIRGAMAFYSWASRGEVGQYLADEAAVELDEDAIADFFCNFALRTTASRVHVIAHSMGNRAVLRAVDRIARDAQHRSGARFGQFVLAAPDVDARKFQQLCASYRAVAERTTLYVSSRDFAVEASRWLHDFPRAGLMPPVTVAEGIDTVNVVNSDITLLGHGYVAESRSVISDLHALIRFGRPPNERFGLQHQTTEHGTSYWLISA